MRPFLNLFFSSSMIISALLVFDGCTRKNSDGNLGLPLEETLRVNINTEPPAIDWNKATDTTSAMMIGNLMSGLTEYKLDDPELGLAPGLALSWTPSENAKTWVLKLRPGVKWTDGVEFNAQQIVDGWERLLNPLTAAEYAYFLFSIKNAKEYNEKKITDFSQVGVKIVDPMTLEIKLAASRSYFPSLLTHHSTYPIRKDVIAKYGDKWTDPDKIVTLGPYKLNRWDHDQQMVLERNPGYWGQAPKVKYILNRMINDHSTAMNLFEAGKIDLLTTLPSIELPVLKKRPEYKGMSNFLLYYYGFNTKKPPFDKVLVRQAFSAAIDREEIVRMLAGGQTATTSWIPTGMFGANGDIGIKFDPKKAKDLLKKAGFEDPQKVPKITIGFNTDDNHKRVAENIQAQLKKNLGVNVELNNEEWKVYLQSLKNDPPQIFRMGWLADFPDPDNFMNLMQSFSENNKTLWGNKKFDDLVDQGAAELDKVKRKDLYDKAQKILVEDDVPAVPLYVGVTHYFFSKRVANFSVNRLSLYDFRTAELRK